MMSIPKAHSQILRLWGASFLALMLCALSAFGPEIARAQSEGDGGEPLVIGSKKFTESVILGDVLGIVLEAEDVPSTHRRELGGTQMLFGALKSGDIDLYPEYTGTLFQEIFASQALRSEDDMIAALEKDGIAIGPSLGFNNTYALGMIRSRAESLGISTISDLKAHPDLNLGFSSQFLARPDGWPGVKATYDLPQERPRGMDHDLAYRGLKDGSLDVVDLYSTDAEIPYYDILVLDDDQHHFPQYNALLLYRLDAMARHPELAKAFAHLEGRITEGAMAKLNGEVKVGRKGERQVAAAFVSGSLGLDVKGSSEAPSALDSLVTHTLEHLAMVGISLLAAIAMAIPLGVWAARSPGPGRWILGAVGLIQTIPSLALLVFMIPLLGIGFAPATLALFLYSLLPIVRNTHAGLLAIPEGLRQSAVALGLGPGPRLRLIELPLALPSILAGIKTSAVINVGTATLGALIGAGGLGQPILTGIRLDNTGLILQGAIPAAALALLVQGAFDLLENKVVPEGLK